MPVRWDGISYFPVRNVQRTFAWCVLFLSGLAVNIATSELADKGSYTSAMREGQSRLDSSYEKSDSADKKAGQAKEICKSKDRASEIELGRVNEAQKKLRDEARALADEALEHFRSAETLDPGNAEAVFFQGLALLQLQNYCSAISMIQSAREAHYRNPDQPAETTFALGAALVGASSVGSPKFCQGIALLADYIAQAKANSNGTTAFPNLGKANDIYKAAVGQPTDLLTKYREKNHEPNRAACPLPIPGKTELPFAAFILSAIGYNDNVITLGRGQLLPPGTPQKESLYNESSFGLSRDFPFSHPSALSDTTGWLSDRLSLKYLFTADTFFDLPDSDRILQTFAGSYQRAFTPNAGGLIKVSDQLLYVTQNPASNIFSAQHALVLDFNARWKSLLSYYLIRTDSLTPVIPLNNPDGFTHRIEMAHIWVVRQDGWDFSPILTLTGQYAHEWDQPNGIAGQFQREEVLGKIEYKLFHARDQCSFIRAVTTSASELWQTDRYSHAFASPNSGNLVTRSDTTNQLVFAMSVTMWYDQYMQNIGVPDGNRLEALLQYRYTTRDSNVEADAFNQNLFFASLKLNF